MPVSVLDAEVVARFDDDGLPAVNTLGMASRRNQLGLARIVVLHIVHSGCCRF